MEYPKPIYLTQCSWCTRVRNEESNEWSRPLGRNVKRFHRRRVEQGLCEECEPKVYESMGLSMPEELIAD